MNILEFLENCLFLTNRRVSIVTTEEPVFFTAFVMKDIFEILDSSLKFKFTMGCDITFDLLIRPKVKHDKKNNFFKENFIFMIVLENIHPSFIIYVNDNYINR